KGWLPNGPVIPGRASARTRNPAPSSGFRARELRSRPGMTASVSLLISPPAMTSPSTFVLVHGAWMGGWAWSRLVPLLEAEGHRVYAPTLTGLAERASLLTKDVNLSTHIEDVSRLLIAEDLEDVVLVGHSYGGMVISGAADRMAEKIKSLVVLDGFVPEDGKAMREYWPASVMSYLDKEASISGGVSVPPLPAESLAIETDNREWVDKQVTPQPYGTFNEIIRLSGARDE